jgi:hypothetical protein
MQAEFLVRLEREVGATPLVLPWLEQGVDGPDGVATLAACLQTALAQKSTEAQT